MYESVLVSGTEGFLFSSQAGVRDYEKFNEQLDSLSRWIVEAEEVLKGQDPNGSSDQSLIWNRMEELKVCKAEWTNYAEIGNFLMLICRNQGSVIVN